MSYRYLVATGVIVPDTSTLFETVGAEFDLAFGTTLIKTPNTPQGALIAAEVSARSEFLQNNAALANQINPNIAGGVFLDAIWQLTGSQRSAAYPSSAVVDVTGVAGTILPIGSTVANTEGIEFASRVAITLDVDGNGSGMFYCTTDGAIGAPADTLVVIVDGVIGWETANNPNAATLGASVQSDASARTERKATIGAQGTSLSEATIAAVTLVPGVVGAPTFRDNPSSSPATIDGINMVANSIYVCAAGGTDLDVATAIYAKKSGGCNYNNGASSNPVSQSVVDPYSGQTQTVLFDRPDELLVLVQVNIAASSATEDPTDAVTEAVLAYANGEVAGEAGFAVGQSVSPWEIAGAINRAAPNLSILSVLITFESPLDYQPVVLPVALWEQAYTNAVSIEVNTV